MLVFDSSQFTNKTRVTNYSSPNCWKVMNCPEDLRKKCWVYRFNLGKEWCILRKKARKELNWKNPQGCTDCDFYSYISKKIQD